MAFILELKEWNIVPKTNPKPIQNQLKNYYELEYKGFCCESESECRKVLNWSGFMNPIISGEWKHITKKSLSK